MKKMYHLFDQPGEGPPVWAVENTNRTVFDISPIWGLVDNLYLNFSRVQSLEKSSIVSPSFKSLDQFKL